MKKTVLSAVLAATALTSVPAFGDPPPWAPAHGYRAHQAYNQQRYYSTDNGINYWQGNDGRYYCKRSNGTTGLLIGGAAGALVGRAIDTRGSRTTGTILGAAAGALLGREVVTDLAQDLPLVPLDAVLIEQVLVNLLENALKYSPPQSPLEVRARTCAAGVEVLVADRGPGIPPGHELRIFDKFYRVNAGQAGGVGLGLAICRGIVMAHGGKLWLEARLGGGAEFHFELPVDGAAPSLESAPLSSR